MTDQDFIAWLHSSDAFPVTLVEVSVDVGGTVVTRYLSSSPYITGPAETPPNRPYQTIIDGGMPITEQVSLEGDAGLVFGDIELANHDGSLDSWAFDVWRNQPVKQWIGDARWPRADFRLVFDGLVDDIDGTKDINKLNIKIRDKMQRLNTAITDTKLGGTSSNADAIIPLVFGEGSNVVPLLIDPNTLTYQVHGGRVDSIEDVRDLGMPVLWTPDAAAGKFTLQSGAQPTAITVSVKGDAPAGAYSNRIAPLVQRIVTGYGSTAQRLTGADLDAANLSTFDAAHPQPVGLVVSDRTNVITACQQLAASVGAQVIMSATGLLRLIQIALPAPGPITNITVHNIRTDDGGQSTFRPVERLVVKGAVKVGYCKIQLAQTNLVTNIPTAHKDLYAKEWLTKTAVDAAVQARYQLDADPVQRDTCLMVGTDAQAEAQRELDLRKVPRTVYQFEGTPEMLMLELGAAGNITHPRHNLTGGADCVVVMLAKNWAQRRVTVGVMV